MFNKSNGFKQVCQLLLSLIAVLVKLMSSPRGTLYNGLYRETTPKKGTFFRLQVMTGYGIHELEYMKGLENLLNK